MTLFKQRVYITKIEVDFELLSIEIIDKNSRNIVINNFYRPQGGRVNLLKINIAYLFEKLSSENKKVFMVEDFNMNSLDYSANA